MRSARISTALNVPFLDLGRVHEGLKDEILAGVGDLLDSSAFTNGPEVAEFEHAYASYCGTAHVVAVASGLDALKLCLLAAGVGPGDEVVVPSLTFIATFEAVTQAGAVPVVVDVNEGDYGLDSAAADAAVTSRTRFLLPVHLYGQMADMRALIEIAARRGIAILEDACQAHGAHRDGLQAGGGGLAGAFSFYPGKNLGAMGDAGALVTNDGELAERIRALREHGQRAKYDHEFQGYTARLDTIQALVLLRKLPFLDRWNEERRAAARFYGEALAGVGDLQLPQVAEGSSPVWHLYVVRTADPDGLSSFLRERGVGTGRHYPQPPHLAPAYEGLGHRPGAFPVAEAMAATTISLPIFPGITEAELATVAAAVTDYFRNG